jgi:hypothetical protein
MIYYYLIIPTLLLLLIFIYKAFISVKEVSKCCNADLWFDMYYDNYNKKSYKQVCIECNNSCKTKLIVKFKNKWYERK